MNFYAPLGLHRMPTRRDRRRRVVRRWVFWGIALAMLPAIAHGAYTVGFLVPANNLSDLTSASAARTNLGLGSAATKSASGASATVASVTGTITSGHIATFADTIGTLQDGGSPAVAPSISKFIGSLPATLSSTSMVTTVSSMGTPAAGTYNLPASHSAGWKGCLKDGSTNFASNNATIKGPSGNIYANAGAVAATTGITAAQQGEELCFLDDGTDYYVE